MGKIVERLVNAERVEDLMAVFGSFDENIKHIEDSLNVQVVNRGTDLRVTGDEEMVDKAVRTLEGLLSLASKGETIDEQRVRYLITLAGEFHRFYNACRIKGEAPEVLSARLKLADAVRAVIANCLALLGVSAPEKM